MGVSTEVIEIAEVRGDDCAKEESEKILEKMKNPSVVFSPSGKNLTSEEFASVLEKIASKTGRVDFVIGGSCGLSDEVCMSADECVSCGQMTFPHQLFRVVAIEQVYRAVCIGKGKVYHK